MLNRPVKKPVSMPTPGASGNVQPPSQNVQLPHKPVNQATDGKSHYQNTPVSMPK